MSKNFRSTIDLSGALGHITAGATKGLTLATEHLLTEANKTVPHDEGTLERSGSTEVQGLVGAVGYNTPYAVKQHEDMTLQHEGKGEPKWLEQTFQREAETVGQIIATAIRDEVGT